ncbi:MAG: ABC transporter ATP-binding protein, partial [Clostridia bacterium]|nr:ABC transporter ATP-binding protein [Clostridia bacterium]
MKPKNNRPDRILTYFRTEWLPLVFITVSGLLYNVGLLAGPWFEGRLAQCLADILGGSDTAAHMVMLVLAYITVTLLVQAARFIKRF